MWWDIDTFKHSISFTIGPKYDCKLSKMNLFVGYDPNNINYYVRLRPTLENHSPNYTADPLASQFFSMIGGAPREVTAIGTLADVTLKAGVTYAFSVENSPWGVWPQLAGGQTWATYEGFAVYNGDAMVDLAFLCYMVRFYSCWAAGLRVIRLTNSHFCLAPDITARTTVPYLSHDFRRQRL